MVTPGIFPASERTSALGQFLRRQCGNAALWNCSTMPADWCVLLGHPDFAAAWRDVVAPEACTAIPIEAGGLIALWDRGIGNRLPAVSTLYPGDIAVVRLAKDIDAALYGRDAGAIFTGERWAIKGKRRVHFIALQTVEPLKVWRP